MNIQVQGWHVTSTIPCSDCGQSAKVLVEIEDQDTGYFWQQKNLCELCLGTDRYTILKDAVADALQRAFTRDNPMT